MSPKQQQYSLGDPNLDKNPFEGILAQLQSRQSAGGQPSPIMQGLPPAGGTPAGGPPPQMMAQTMAGGKQPKMPPNQLNPGEDSGNSQELLSAIQQLQRYIVAESDPNNITVVRSIISLIAKLVQKDQEQQAAMIPQHQQQLEAMQPPQGGGTPTGTPAPQGPQPGA